MTTNNENTISNFAEALLLATQSLRKSIRDIDDLNGRLEELEHYNEHRYRLSESAVVTLEEAYDFYVRLPVWDTLESLAERLMDVRREVVRIKSEEARSNDD